ncbi:MAG TPA: hypothetical protein VH643_21275 [Gemmataceae bacterium]|jgi:hypothetical protein
MGSLAVSGIVFACIFAAMILGMTLRAILPERHLCTDTKDLIKLGMGVIGTLTALVLGLLIASAKGSTDTERDGLARIAGDIIFLDRTLVEYGPETKDARETLRAFLLDMLQTIRPAEKPELGHADAKSSTDVRYEGELYRKILELVPERDSQRTLKAQALRTATDIAQTDWLLFAKRGSSIPTPFLVVMVSWLVLIVGSFSLLAPPRSIVFITLLMCNLAASSAIYLIDDLDRPFEGMIQVSIAPLRSARTQLGRAGSESEAQQPAGSLSIDSRHPGYANRFSAPQQSATRPTTERPLQRCPHTTRGDRARVQKGSQP